MLKFVTGVLIALLAFAAGYFVDRGWNRTNRYISSFFYVYSGAMPSKGIDKVCIVNRNNPNYPKQSLLEIVGSEEVGRSFGSCGSELDACCPSISETNSVLVIKRGTSLTCNYTHFSFENTAPVTLCAVPSEIKALLPKIDALQGAYMDNSKR
jgi:hypothetical protein